LTSQPLRVAAVQMQAALGDVRTNLDRAERLVRDGFRRGATWVTLPEFFTSAVAFHPRLLEASRPLTGAPMQFLQRLAREHDGVVSGSFLARRGDHTYNTFVAAFPDGRTVLHDKDQPTMWENCYYVGGADDGVWTTSFGRVGVALCWEFIRTRTARRLRGRVDMVIGGTCWWDWPDHAPPEQQPARERNKTILKETPGRFAQLLGVPVVHASHAGTFEGLVPPEGKKPYRSRYLGETQIVDGSGNVLARMSSDDGEGVIVADILPGEIDREPDAIPEGFWIPDLPDVTLSAWEFLNRHGQDYYQSTTLPYQKTRGEEKQTAGKGEA
jgi:predicted amidohydrolase